MVVNYNNKAVTKRKKAKLKTYYQLFTYYYHFVRERTDTKKGNKNLRT